jgi:hypothetical protein
MYSLLNQRRLAALLLGTLVTLILRSLGVIMIDIRLKEQYMSLDLCGGCCWAQRWCRGVSYGGRYATMVESTSPVPDFLSKRLNYLTTEEMSLFCVWQRQQHIGMRMR